MRREKNVFYSVEVQGLWWLDSDRAFGDLHGYSGSASSFRWVSRSDRAHRIAIAALQKFNKQTQVTQYFYKHGKRYCKTWIYEASEHV